MTTNTRTGRFCGFCCYWPEQRKWTGFDWLKQCEEREKITAGQSKKTIKKKCLWSSIKTKNSCNTQHRHFTIGMTSTRRRSIGQNRKREGMVRKANESKWKQMEAKGSKTDGRTDSKTNWLAYRLWSQLDSEQTQSDDELKLFFCLMIKNDCSRLVSTHTHTQDDDELVMTWRVCSKTRHNKVLHKNQANRTMNTCRNEVGTKVVQEKGWRRMEKRGESAGKNRVGCIGQRVRRTKKGRTIQREITHTLADARTRPTLDSNWRVNRKKIGANAETRREMNSPAAKIVRSKSWAQFEGGQLWFNALCRKWTWATWSG